MPRGWSKSPQGGGPASSAAMVLASLMFPAAIMSSASAMGTATTVMSLVVVCIEGAVAQVPGDIGVHHLVAEARRGPELAQLPQLARFAAHLLLQPHAGLSRQAPRHLRRCTCGGLEKGLADGVTVLPDQQYAARDSSDGHDYHGRPGGQMTSRMAEPPSGRRTSSTLRDTTRPSKTCLLESCRSGAVFTVRRWAVERPVPLTPRRWVSVAVEGLRWVLPQEAGDVRAALDDDGLAGLDGVRGAVDAHYGVPAPLEG